MGAWVSVLDVNRALQHWRVGTLPAEACSSYTTCSPLWSRYTDSGLRSVYLGVLHTRPPDAFNVSEDGMGVELDAGLLEWWRGWSASAAAHHSDSLRAPAPSSGGGGWGPNVRGMGYAYLSLGVAAVVVGFVVWKKRGRR